MLDFVVGVPKKSHLHKWRMNLNGTFHMSRSTLKQAAVTSDRLEPPVIEGLGRITNEENPERTFEVYKGTSIECLEVSLHSIPSSVDCRIYREFINITSLKSATSFMNASECKDFDAQIVTLRKAKFILVERAHRPVRYKDIFGKYDVNLETIEQMEKFERYLEFSVCPFMLSAVKENILHTTKLNKEIKLDSGNKFTIFQLFLEKYGRYYPMQAPGNKYKFKSSYDFTKDTPTLENILDKAGSRGLDVPVAKLQRQ